jgi:DNA polymerase III alpha subunit
VDLPNFITPHCHVQSLDSGSTPAAFAAREVELGTGALVVTDHGSLAACQTVYDIAKKGVGKDKVKLTPILGLEGYFRDDDCGLLLGAGHTKRYPKDDKGNNIVFDENGIDQGSFVDVFKYGHFTTHFLDQNAFKTAIRLLSHAPIEKHGSEQKPLFDWQAMEELGASNATITSGCLIGMVQRHLLDRQDPKLARAYYERMRGLVKPGNFYVEVFPHICSHNWVQGVFLTLQEEDREPFKIRFYAGKNLKTNVGETKAEELAKAFKRTGNKHTHLLAVKDYHTWNDRTPAKLVAVEHVEDFIQNECRPFAPDGDVQLGANEWMIQIAREYGDPILISDDSHYAHPEEKVVQDVRLAQSGSWRFYGSYHRQSSAEAFEYFKHKLGVDQKTFQGWVENSLAWRDRFKDFKLEAKPDLPTKFYEELYTSAGAKDSLGYTIELIKKHGRMNWKDPVWVARLTQEINLLHRNGVIDLLPYFFIDEEVCRLYRDKGFLTGPGRGSAAGLLLTYLLGITHVDPIRYGLSVDRFLTVDRIKSGKLPDIDQDLPSRDLLVGEDGKGGWLQERFGECVAQISTIMTLKLRSAVLDVARFTLGEVPRDIAELTRKFEMPPQGLDDVKHVLGYEDSGNWVEGSITRDPALQAYVATYPEQWEIVKKCLGLGRGVSRHACAYVIANRPIWEFIPLTKISDITCTQFTAPAVEAAGGLKMDFLVINSLNDIAAAIKLVQDRWGSPPDDGLTLDGKYVPALRLLPFPGTGFGTDMDGRFVDIWDLPEDQSVFADISTGKTETVFQFNTPGAVQWLRHFGHQKDSGNYAIDSIEAMAAFTALDRPGPLDAMVRNPDVPEAKHNMLVEYARRARGAKATPDIFPVFDRLFPETHGVMVYQEQLQRLYQEVVGCSGAEAEEFRGNVAKKKKEKIIEAYPKFLAGASESMGSKESAEAVWKFIQSWAAYGFNKSHAVCYVVIAYACAYLKHHYPLEWWTAVLCNADKNEINEKFWRYAGHLINLPDVTKAFKNFAIVDERIQAPLSLLHGVGETAHKELVEGAPFTSIDDLVHKIEARKLAGTTTKKAKKKVKEKVVTNEGVVVQEKEVEVDRVVKGRSALNTGIVSKLIISGAMDKLFPEDTPTLQMLEEYELARWRYENEVRANRKPKAKTPKKAPDPVKPEYTNLNQYTRYQLRKSILPAYSESVLKMAVERQHGSIQFHKNRWTYFGWSVPVQFANAAGYERMSHMVPPADGSGIRIAIAAYVEDVRVFQYGARKEKKACDLTLDLDGSKMKFVRWPDRETGELDDGYDTSLKGCLVIAVLSKFKDGKPFSIDHLEIIQGALGADKPEETPEESPEPKENE